VLSNGGTQAVSAQKEKLDSNNKQMKIQDLTSGTTSTSIKKQLLE